MQKRVDQSSRWVQKEAAKHTTPESMRQRIVFEQKQIQALMGTGLWGGPTENALKAHHELIRVLTERLAKFQ
ncbi:hypothetical protein [Microvirga tunisiensis]|jgi:hypothetical protein|uniref:Uncharacterized protein n=1 Tax=Microvirga tunisiensis TaxID=2108360 RepID=A0A5N7MV69_9HYPH|nr:hypothetical protein [Microvirga tunisiensis]MPR13080.1 hypothetical protein [Microvirga tunisiensis]MPR30788.1 hypothetical protein [Microvirga tunisiensis]